MIGVALKGVAFEKKSEKLCDPLNLAEVETDVETQKKEEAIEVLKLLVRDLRSAAAPRGDEDGEGVSENKLAAASEIQLLAKEDSEARVILAMLGAIPPLVSMIDDSRIANAQISSLYVLLNLGIGNDVVTGRKRVVAKVRMKRSEGGKSEYSKCLFCFFGLIERLASISAFISPLLSL